MSDASTDRQLFQRLWPFAKPSATLISVAIALTVALPGSWKAGRCSHHVGPINRYVATPRG